MKRRELTLLLILLLTLIACGCDAEPTEVKPSPAVLQTSHHIDWDRINGTIEDYTYPQSELLFAPREAPSESERDAQARLRIRFNRNNRHYAIFKTVDSLDKIIAFYIQQGLKPQPATRPDQRILFSEARQAEVVLTQVATGTNITIGVSSTEPPEIEVANETKLPKSK